MIIDDDCGCFNPSYITALREGEKARKKNFTLEYNPYEYGTFENTFWTYGWHDMDEALRNKND